MSLRSLPRASIALRGCRRGPAWRVYGGVSQRRWASEENRGEDKGRPFYLQLNESIYERVQKEKEEQIKIQSLQQRTARGQFFATVFGTAELPTPSYMLDVTFCPCILTESSMPSHGKHRLLLGPNDSPQTRHQFDGPPRSLHTSQAQHI